MSGNSEKYRDRPVAGEEKTNAWKYLLEKGQVMMPSEIASGSLNKYKQQLDVDLPTKTLQELFKRYRTTDEKGTEHLDVESITSAIYAFSLDKEEFVGLDNMLKSLDEDPNRLLKPDELETLQKLVLSFLAQNGKEQTVSSVKEMAKTIAVLKLIGTGKRRLQLFEFLIKDTTAETLSQNLKITQAFVESGYIEEKAAKRLAERYLTKGGVDQQSLLKDLAKIKPLVQQQIAGQKGQNYIEISNFLHDDRRIAALAGSYYSAISALVNLALFIGNPNDERYLGYALGFAGLGTFSLNEATKGSPNDTGFVTRNIIEWMNKDHPGKKDQSEQRQEVKKEAKFIIGPEGSNSRNFFANNTTIGAIRETFQAAAKDKKSKLGNFGTNKDSQVLISLLGEKLKSKNNDPEAKAAYELLQKNAKNDPAFNNKIFKMGLVYELFNVKTGDQLLSEFTYRPLYS